MRVFLRPSPKRARLTLQAFVSDEWPCDEDEQSVCLSDAASSDVSTADELVLEAEPSEDCSDCESVQVEDPKDHEVDNVASSEDEDERSRQRWAAGSVGPMGFLMLVDQCLLDELSEVCCLSSNQSLPNNNGWILEEDALFELALSKNS